VVIAQDLNKHVSRVILFLWERRFNPCPRRNWKRLLLLFDSFFFRRMEKGSVMDSEVVGVSHSRNQKRKGRRLDTRKKDNDSKEII
jgi:hypothetical protein